MKKTLKIKEKKIGEKEPIFIIAEIGINHNGEIEIAKEMIKKAKKAGADCVKFQTFKTEKFLSKNIEIPEHVESKETFFDDMKKLEFTEEELKELYNYCQENNIMFLSSVFDKESVDLLDEIGMPAFKVASCDLNNLPFLKYIAKKQKPIILSTGMGSIGEIEEAINVIKNEGNDDIILLHCVSMYPPKLEDINLNSMKTLKKAFKIPVGFSDHTIGTHIPLAAVALGAVTIEKHFTLDKEMEGPDHEVSMEPQELEDMINKIRDIQMSMGDGIKQPTPDEIKMRKAFRRSLVAKQDIEVGEKITKEKIEIKRPGTGIPPNNLELVIGREAKNELKKDDLIKFDYIS